MSSFPFLVGIKDSFKKVRTEPYAELQRYLAAHPAMHEIALAHLSYVDAAWFLPRVSSSCLVLGSLADDIAPAADLARLTSDLKNAELRLYEGGHTAGAVRSVRSEIDEWILDRAKAATM